MAISASPASPDSSLVSINPLDPLRRVPNLQVRERIDDILPDIRQCTLRELSIFGRGFNPGTSAVNVSAFYKGTETYRDVLVNNLSEALYSTFLDELALVLGRSRDEIEKVGYFCYNARRGFKDGADIPTIPLQLAIAPDHYVRAIGSHKGDKWIHFGE